MDWQPAPALKAFVLTRIFHESAGLLCPAILPWSRRARGQPATDAGQGFAPSPAGRTALIGCRDLSSLKTKKWPFPARQACCQHCGPEAAILRQAPRERRDPQPAQCFRAASTHTPPHPGDGNPSARRSPRVVPRFSGGTVSPLLKPLQPCGRRLGSGLPSKTHPGLQLHSPNLTCASNLGCLALRLIS